MKFSIHMPGLIRFPPALFVEPHANWETTMGVADHQRIAQAVERLGFDAITISEHVVVPTELVRHMGGHFPAALAAMWFLAGATRRSMMRSNRIVLP